MPATSTIEPVPQPYNSPAGKRYNEWRCLEKTKSIAWDQAIEKLAAEIKTRQGKSGASDPQADRQIHGDHILCRRNYQGENVSPNRQRYSALSPLYAGNDEVWCNTASGE